MKAPSFTKKGPGRVGIQGDGTYFNDRAGRMHRRLVLWTTRKNAIGIIARVERKMERMGVSSASA